jgi:hypothetical protein
MAVRVVVTPENGRIWRICWWNTWIDPITGRERWGWVGWYGSSIRAPDQLLAHLTRLTQ